MVTAVLHRRTEVIGHPPLMPQVCGTVVASGLLGQNFRFCAVAGATRNRIVEPADAERGSGVGRVGLPVGPRSVVLAGLHIVAFDTRSTGDRLRP